MASMRGKTALITGITGQDGGYLTDLLLREGYAVHGMIRPTAALHGTRLEALSRAHPGRVLLHNADLTDTSSLAALMEKSAPDEVYHLAGQSHVQVSFDLPEYTGESHSVRELRAQALTHVGLDYRDYVRQDPELFQPVDITETRGDGILLEWRDDGTASH